MGVPLTGSDRAEQGRARRRLIDLLAALRQPTRSPALSTVLWCIVCASPIYGLAMGSYQLSGERAMYAIYAAIKLPLMITVTTALCLPGFFALTSVLGLRSDLRASMRAILCGQAAFATTLASLAPVTLLAYVSGVSTRGALIVSGIAFIAATLVAQSVMWARYRPLIARAPQHLAMLAYWLGAYVFVGIQMGWMLRPFVGTPGIAPSFLRPEPFSNAYLIVWRLVVG